MTRRSIGRDSGLTHGVLVLGPDAVLEVIGCDGSERSAALVRLALCFRHEETVRRSFPGATVEVGAIVRVPLTDGTPPLPCIRPIFVDSFGETRIELSGEPASITRLLALIGPGGDVAV